MRAVQRPARALGCGFIIAVRGTCNKIWQGCSLSYCPHLRSAIKNSGVWSSIACMQWISMIRPAVMDRLHVGPAAPTVANPELFESTFSPPCAGCGMPQESSRW